VVAKSRNFLVATWYNVVRVHMRARVLDAPAGRLHSHDCLADSFSRGPRYVPFEVVSEMMRSGKRALLFNVRIKHDSQ